MLFHVDFNHLKDNYIFHTTYSNSQLLAKKKKKTHPDHIIIIWVNLMEAINKISWEYFTPKSKENNISILH